MSQSDIENYIRQNRTVYTREVLTQTLIAAGHKPEDVEKAWAAADQDPQPKQSHANQITFMILLWLVFTGCSSSLLFLMTAAQQRMLPVDLLFAVTDLLAVVAGVILVRRGVGFKRVLAGVMLVNFIWVFIIFGICTTNLN